MKLGIWQKIKGFFHRKSDINEFYSNLGDHIIVSMDENTLEPFIRVMLTDKHTPERATNFAHILQDLNSGEYVSSILSLLKDIGTQNPIIKQKVTDIVMSWEYFYALNKHNISKEKQKNKLQPLIKPRHFSQNQISGE